MYEDVTIDSDVNSSDTIPTDLTIMMSPVHCLSTKRAESDDDWVLPPDPENSDPRSSDPKSTDYEYAENSGIEQPETTRKERYPGHFLPVRKFFFQRYGVAVRIEFIETVRIPALVKNELIS